MANKAISELPQALNVNNQDLFVLEQSGIAKKLTAETFITEQGIIDALAEALDGHGGIQSVTLSSVSGRIRTYLITFTDGSATTFQVYDGTTIERIAKTSTAGLVDTYTIFMNDGTTTFFTVTNGADGTVSEAMLNDALKNKAPAITETTESSAIANFTDGADDMVMHNVVAEINPVQSGSGDPSPDNIRPITGWTGVNVTRTGKNLFDKNAAIDGKFINASGQEIASGNYGHSTPIKVKPNTKYCMTGYAGTGYYSMLGLDANMNALPAWYGGASKTAPFVATTPSNCAYIILNYLFAQKDSIAFYESDTVGEFIPYQGNTYTIQLGDTVYGGTIDVATGLLTVTHQYLTDNGSLNWAMNDDGSFYVRNPSSAAVQDATGCCCNYAPFAVSYSGLNVFFGSNGLISLAKGWGSYYATADALKVAFANTPIQFVYKLATPQTYQLTGQEVIKTLLGTNAVWADTGNVSVTYAADTKMFIEKLTMPTEDDLVANQAITSGKYFMVGNSLYLALANIASGAQITIGTNAQRVSLADALNTINS